MKLQGPATAVSVLIILILIAGMVWIFTALMPSSSTTGTEGRGVFGTLFPFGRSGSLVPPSSENTPGDTSGPVSQVRRVTDAPVAGAQFVIRADGVEVLRYIERDSGHWYEVPVDVYTTTRLSNTTVPGVHDVAVVSSTTMVMRILGEADQIDNFLGQYTSTSTDGALTGVLLEHYRQLDAHGGSLVGIRDSTAGSIIEKISPDGFKVSPVFASQIGSWIPHIRGDRVFISSAPASGLAGSWYEIVGGDAKRIVGELPGLEVLISDDASRALISTGSVNTASLLAYSAAQDSLITLPLRTLADKCVWETAVSVLCAVPRGLPGGRYPTDWHLGRIHTTDDVWRIDTDTGATTAVLELEQFIPEPIDGSHLSSTKDGYVAFINKRDGGLWLAKLSE